MSSSKIPTIYVESSIGQDAVVLDALGHPKELEQKFSALSMLGFAFAILNTWTALAASLAVALPTGGPVTALWGLLIAGLCSLAISASLAEMCSVWPIAAGQYYWTAALSPPNWAPLLSFACGWINVMGWWALVAAGASLGASLITGIFALLKEEYIVKTWHTYTLYLGFLVIATLANSQGMNYLPAMNKFALYWSVFGAVIISITILITSAPNYQSPRFVFTEFFNDNTGWPDGMALLLGLLPGTLSLTAFDAVAHMVEEVPRPHINAPRAMIYAIPIGVCTGLVFQTCLFFVISDFKRVIDSPAGPLLEILYQATHSKIQAVVLDMFPIGCLVFGTISIATTSSRLTFAFARDNGLPLSPHLAKISNGVPRNSLFLTIIIDVFFGLLYFVSDSALHAILSASVVALGISYGLPIFTLLLRGRSFLPKAAFSLGRWGLFVNYLGLSFILLTTILFLFPAHRVVDASSMNYTIVAFAVVFGVSVFRWYFHGRLHFSGPFVISNLEIINGIEGDFRIGKQVV